MDEYGLLEQRAIGELIMKQLTQREKEVLAWLAEGESEKGIAARLGISWQTVKNHTSHIRMKFDVENKHQLISKAYRLGLID